jgi:phage I-like protein
VPTNSGQRQSTRYTLTREEREYARIAGVSEAEYAKNKQKLAEMKANGLYGERR